MALGLYGGLGEVYVLEGGFNSLLDPAQLLDDFAGASKLFAEGRPKSLHFLTNGFAHIAPKSQG
jgi:hypothetical protein